MGTLMVCAAAGRRAAAREPPDGEPGAVDGEGVPAHRPGPGAERLRFPAAGVGAVATMSPPSAEPTGPAWPLGRAVSGRRARTAIQASPRSPRIGSAMSLMQQRRLERRDHHGVVDVDPRVHPRHTPCLPARTGPAAHAGAPDSAHEAGWAVQLLAPASTGRCRRTGNLPITESPRNAKAAFCADIAGSNTLAGFTTHTTLGFRQYPDGVSHNAHSGCTEIAFTLAQDAAMLLASSVMCLREAQARQGGSGNCPRAPMRAAPSPAVMAASRAGQASSGYRGLPRGLTWPVHPGSRASSRPS